VRGLSQEEIFHKCFFYRSIVLLPPAGGGWEGGQRGQSVPPSSRASGFPPSSPPPLGGGKPVEVRVLRYGEPALDALLELVGRHASMRDHHQLDQGLFATSKRTFEVASEEGLERLLFLPLGMLGRQRLDEVVTHCLLVLHGLLSPESIR